MTSPDRPPRVVTLVTRAYALALRLLPSGFRERYGQELRSCFTRLAADAHREHGAWAVAGITLRALVDLTAHAPHRHLRTGARTPGAADMWAEIPRAVRRLARRPSFTASCVATLALGIAATTSAFSLVHGVVLNPLPYPDSERIVQVDHGASGLQQDRGLGIAYGFFRFYREQLRGVESIAMYTRFDLTLTGEGDPVRVAGAGATPSLVDVLGVRPALGRWFDAAEAAPGAASTVVVSHAFWRDRLGGDPAVLGRAIVLDGTSAEIVGVMPEGFAFPDPTREFWMPRAVPTTGIGGWNELAVARLTPGTTPADLAREIEGIFPIIRDSGDDPERVAMYLDEAGVHPRIVPLKLSVVGDVSATLWILLGAVGVVLVIAVANVANLFLVRLEDGQRDTALRAALGASGGRLLAGFAAESAVVVLVAGVLGMGGARLAIDVLKARAPVEVPRLQEVTLDPAVAAAAIGICLLTVLLLSIAPAHRLSARRFRALGATLVEGGGRGTASRSRVLGRHVLMGAQVALALVLLVGSGLLFRTFRELQAVDLGFAERDALTFRIALPDARYASQAEATAFHDTFLRRLEALPGVRAAGAVGQCLPLSGTMCWGDVLEPEGHVPSEGDLPIVTGMRIAGPGYFEAMRIPVRGRVFAPDELEGPAAVAILSEATAAAHFPGVDPIGRRIRVSGAEDRWYRVIGVARDVRAQVSSDEFTRALYLPLGPELVDGPPPSHVTYVVATSLPPSSLVPAVRAALAEVDPVVPLSEVSTLDDLVSDALGPTAFALALTGLAAGVALLLGTVGVYAVIAYVVGGRTREIGVRMALGAHAGSVQRMVLRQGGAVILIGIGVGLVGAYLLTGLMSGMLYGVSPADPLSFGSVTALMLLVSGLALWIPARRAARIDPLEALRSD